MTIKAAPSRKSETILLLAMHAYSPNPRDAKAQAQLRWGLEAIVDELRRIQAIPATDIDQFIADAKAGADAEKLMVPAVLFATMLPDVDYYAAMVSAGFSDEAHPTPVHPKFLEAGDALVTLQDKHGEAAQDLPEYDGLWKQLLEFAPPEFMATLREGAKKFGLLPETKYVNDAGEPMYSAEQLAEKLGMPVEQVEKDLHEKLGDRLVTGNVHQLQ